MDSLKILLLLVVALSASACSQSDELAAEVSRFGSTASDAAAMRTEGEGAFPPTEYEEYKRFAAEARGHLVKEEFSLLDSLSDELRGKKARYPGGAWKLEKFYWGLTSPADGHEGSDEEWQNHIARLRKWKQTNPRSITARVALASALCAYGGKARGTGYADTVTPEGWRLSAERKQASFEELMEARQLDAKCPEWWLQMLYAARGLGAGLADYRKIFEEGVAFEPAYHYYYEEMATFLLPRWSGEPGDWERFADEQATRVGGKEGSALYATIAWSISGYYKGSEFFKSTQVSWPRMKQGFIDMEALYGASFRIANARCKLACYAGDREEAVAMFHKLARGWDHDIWGTRANYIALRQWAFSG